MAATVVTVYRMYTAEVIFTQQRYALHPFCNLICALIAQQIFFTTYIFHKLASKLTHKNKIFKIKETK
jgi:hypothetical protein